MRLFELCSHQDKIELFHLLIGKTREVLGLNQADVASMAMQDSSTGTKPKPPGVVRAKGLISAKKKARKKVLKKNSPKALATPPQIPGQSPTAPVPGQRAPITSNQPERGAFSTKSVAGLDRWLYQPSTLSKYPGRPTDSFNSLSP
jgi:hypothetical protein